MIFDDLRAIQTRHGFLPKAELESLSQRTQTPLYQIHSVASFYPHFHLAPPPKADLRVCADMSCHLNGASELRSALQSSFANSRPEDVQIRDVSCLGTLRSCAGNLVERPHFHGCYRLRGRTTNPRRCYAASYYRSLITLRNPSNANPTLTRALPPPDKNTQ